NGDGKLTLNGRPLEEYFPRVVDQRAVRAPLEATGAGKTYDIFITLKGGGLSGQSGAAKLGIARALAKADEALVPALRENDLLTRDGRMKERKKPGQKGARKKFQWTKR
ncbi:MAG: 30S ribosomal protein S9, partial [Phycisphaerae bacterium]|nr:30S ribosomal protein S9 [Phycisphaerae bacterium]